MKAAGTGPTVGWQGTNRWGINRRETNRKGRGRSWGRGDNRKGTNSRGQRTVWGRDRFV